MQAYKPSTWAVLYRLKIHHILLWSLYYLFWILFYLNMYPSLGTLTMVVTIYAVSQAIAFYTTAYVLFPKFLYKQKFLLFFLLFISLVIALAFAQGYSLYFIFNFIFKDVNKGFSGLQNFVQFSFVSIITMVGLLAGAKIIVERFKTDRVNQIRDKQRLESELQYLKAQVNPHFLFNAINSIYFLIKKDPDQAAETLIKLSDLLRFQLYDCTGENITIEQEIEYLKNFISLEKVRKGNKVKVNFDLQGHLTGFQIAPFLLIPFVENSFKHISNFDHSDNIIRIKIVGDVHRLILNIENTTEKTEHNGAGGIGLKNVKRRLELLYPKRHTLNVSETGSLYTVNLELALV